MIPKAILVFCSIIFFNNPFFKEDCHFKAIPSSMLSFYSCFYFSISKHFLSSLSKTSLLVVETEILHKISNFTLWWESYMSKQRISALCGKDSKRYLHTIRT